jgi:ornithine cyclodeaminase
MARVAFLFLNRHEVEELMPDMATVMEIVEAGLAAHGRRDVVLPPKSHIHLDDRYNGHFNVLPGYAGHIERAGVKVVGDYVDNYRHGLPSEVALLTVYDPATGVPLCLMDATALTWARTGAVTGIGAKHLARKDAAVVGHIGARGTALANLKAIAACRPLAEVRIASKRPETREALAAQVEDELGVRAVAAGDAEVAADGADIVVEATRLEAPSELIGADAVKPGALLITYGWVRAVAAELATGVDKFVVDDWDQCTKGGTFADLIADGRLTRDGLHAEIGQICAGAKPARGGDGETITFWHRGFAISDIVLGHWIHARALAQGKGRELLLWDGPDE